MRLLLLTLPLLLAGCLSLDGLVSTGAATTGAVVGTALVNPGIGAVLGIGAGVGADLLTPDPAPPLNEIHNIWQLLAFAWYKFTTHIVTLGIVSGFILVLCFMLGIRIPRGEERMMKKMMKQEDK